MALNGGSSGRSKWKYHIFLSFRGEDTRLGFTDHLYTALQKRSIDTFRDNEELRTGEFISQQLLHAIEDSLCAVVVLSPNYANSGWCLDELKKIVETKGSFGMIVPVFFNVDPSDVRYQKGKFAEAFEKHEERYREQKDKVQQWRDALTFVANLSGCTSQDRYESQLIDEIAEEVWTKVEPQLPTKDDDDLVAIESKVNDVRSCLSLEPKGDVLFLGIWGMGGLGKTTLASVVCKRIRREFEDYCILRVGDVSKEGDLVNLQNQLLSHLKLRSRVIETLVQGRDNIRNLLYKKRILIVLDDVRTIEQLENLVGNKEWFGPGSRIVVTTRDKNLLSSHGVFKIYEMEVLNTDESLQLFHQEAFKGELPKEEYLELSKRFVSYTGGLPLALKVLGSNLRRRSIDEWEDALDEIRKDPDGGIMNLLRISYDMLKEGYKTIFLDIACFFRGWYRDKVTKILKNCGLNPTKGISELIGKSLITCNKGVLGMHDLLEDMGKQIVFQESEKDPGKRSRLSSLDDIDQVLEENTGTENIEGMVLKQQFESYNKAANWHPEAFSKMRNLRLLIVLCDLHLSHGFKCLPRSLKVLIWTECPLKALPLDIELRRLVHLQMNNSKLEKPWNGSQVFEGLKVIDLSYSKDLIQTPDISEVPLLEELFLDGCVSLVELHQSVGQHQNLAILSLIGCTKLETLPNKLEMCSLKRLFLCGCTNMKTLPDFGESMGSLSVLNLMKCSNLLCIPDSISNLKSLKQLNLSGCSKVCKVPHNINQNKALEDLDLSETSIRVMNPCLFELENLKRLSFHGCSGPVSNTCELALSFELGFSKEPDLLRLTLPPSFAGLSSLNIFDLGNCNLDHGLIPKNLGELSSLETLILSGNTDLVVPKSVAMLPNLRILEAEGCKDFIDRSVLPRLSDSVVEAGLFLDLWKFWEQFKSNNDELLCQVRDHSYPITYFEIPPKFGNEILFPMGPRLSKLESSASIIADIPNELGGNEWWGIIVFIAFEPLESSTSFPTLKFSWSFESSHPEAGPSLYLSSDAARTHYSCCLVTMIMTDKYIYIQLHHRQYDNISESKPFSKHRKPAFSENSRLRFDVQGGQLKMKECGYDVLCNEDFKSKILPDLENESDDDGSNHYNKIAFWRRFF
ncbi:disease resistance protein RPV1-like [Arachis stenosperma]|nr:disease resistance protein RPV1-like [Arachis stenosperma]